MSAAAPAPRHRRVRTGPRQRLAPRGSNPGVRHPGGRGRRHRHPPARRGQALRRDHRRQRARPRRARGHVRRPARPQRRGQVDDDEAADRAGDRRRGHDRGARLRPAEDSKVARAEMGVVPQLDNLDTTLTVEQNLRVFTYLYRVPRAQRRERDRARARDGQPGRPPRHARRQALGRHAPAAADRPRARAPAAARPARRADRRPGPAGPPGAVGADRRAAQRGHLDPDVHALHRGGRAARRHRDDHVPRRGRRHRPPGRADRAARRPRGRRGLRAARASCARSRPPRARAG